MSTIISRSLDSATITPELVLDKFESTDDGQNITHIVLGSEWPDITLRPAAARTGTLQLLFENAAAAEAARVFHRAAAVFNATSTLAWVPANYVLNGPIRAAQQESRAGRWMLEVPFQEVSP